MPARILIVDSVATNRIILNVKLIAARYQVEAVAGFDLAIESIADEAPDLILISAPQDCTRLTAFCAASKTAPETADIPIIVCGDKHAPAQRIAALGAGADDVMSRPLHDEVLLARIRSLLRARNAARELRLREDTGRTLGMAEAQAGFAAPGRVTVYAETRALAAARAEEIGRTGSHRVLACDLGHRMEDPAADSDESPPDVILIDGTGVDDTRLLLEFPRLVSELRSREESRHAGLIALLPRGADDVAAILLDIGVNDVVEAPVDPGELALRLSNSLRRARAHERLRQNVREELRAAITDPLTGLYNRRFAEPHIARLIERSRDNGTCLAIMVLDVDHFKAINDAHGHAVGDRVLVGVARRLSSNLRPQDLVARIGGEEFLVAMPDTTPQEASLAAERLRAAISGAVFDIGAEAPGLSVTLSIGVAVSPEAGPQDTDPGGRRRDIERLFDRADAALYRAKSAGRNTVNMALTAA